MTVRLEHMHRVDPNMDSEGARRIIAGEYADLPRLRPKARRAKEELIAAMERDLEKLISMGR